MVVDGFPSVGLANAIASECLVRSAKTEFVAVLDSPAFPPLSIIRDAKPNFPARVYANKELRLAMFTSELSLDPAMFRPVANTMLDWALASNCDLAVSAAGMPYEEGEEPKPDTTPEVHAVASTPHALKKAADAGILPIMSCTVAGIPAILLNEGAWRNYDVIVLLVKVLRDGPDFRARRGHHRGTHPACPGSVLLYHLPAGGRGHGKGTEKDTERSRSVKKEQMYG
jgi:uncharacterized protein